MSKLTKNQKVVYAKVDPGKQYKLPEACELIKDTSFTKFDASVDMAVRLGVDPRKANQVGWTKAQHCPVLRNYSYILKSLTNLHAPAKLEL